MKTVEPLPKSAPLDGTEFVQDAQLTPGEKPLPEFALFGGPLQRLGRRLGLVRGANTFGLGVALGLLAWGVWLVLARMQGAGPKVFSLAIIGVHVRFLVAIPLFFLCETWVTPRMAEFVRDLVRSGIVPESEQPNLAVVIQRIHRRRNPGGVEILLLLMAFATPLIESFAILPGRSAYGDTVVDLAGAGVSWSHAWYMGFCMPLFRFLLLRWLWHLGLWCYFLWRVQKLELHLIPTHPDRAAGLGYLEVVQEHFGTMVMALSATYAAAAAEDISSGIMAFETLYLAAPLVLLIVAVLFLGPLVIFSPKLWACRVDGWRRYMGMASRYVEAFDRRWIQDENVTGESQLGTADLQSLADLNNSVTTVREMRWVPASRRLVLNLAICAIVPMVPLLLLKYSLGVLVTRLFQSVTGL